MVLRVSPFQPDGSCSSGMRKGTPIEGSSYKGIQQITPSPQIPWSRRRPQPKFFHPTRQSINHSIINHEMLSLFRTSGVVSGRRTFSSTAPALNNFAKIAILGRLAAEPEISTSQNGVEMIRYAVGVSSGKDKPTTWYKIVDFSPDDRSKEYLMSMQRG